jgi:hypothetical protein
MGGDRRRRSGVDQPVDARMLEVRGHAEAVPTGGAGLGPGIGDGFIRIYPEKINSFGIG